MLGTQGVIINFLSAKNANATQVLSRLYKIWMQISRLPSIGLDHYASESHANQMQS